MIYIVICLSIIIFIWKLNSLFFRSTSFSTFTFYSVIHETYITKFPFFWLHLSKRGWTRQIILSFYNVACSTFPSLVDFSSPWHFLWLGISNSGLLFIFILCSSFSLTERLFNLIHIVITKRKTPWCTVFSSKISKLPLEWIKFFFSLIIIFM